MHRNVKLLQRTAARLGTAWLLALCPAHALALQTPLPLEPTQRIEFTTNEVTWMSLDVSPDGGTIVFGLLGDLYLLPISGGTAQRITSGMALDTQPRFSPEGDRILFVSDRSGSENLWTLELGKTIDDTTETSSESGLYAVTRGKDASYASPAWSPDGRYIVASKTDRFTWIDVHHTLWIHRLDGEEGVELSVGGAPIHGMGAAFGPDPRYLYTAHRDLRVNDGDAFDHRVDRYDLETGELRPVVGRVGGAVRPVLSPDGRFMVYASRHDGQTGYRLRRLSDGVEQWLSFPVQHDLQENDWMGTSSDHMPRYAFTPDGTAIVASIDGKLFRIDVPSGERTPIPFEVDVAIDIAPQIHFDERVPDGPVQVKQIRWPSISPDGSKLAFTAVHRLYVMELDGGRIERVAEMQDVQAAPAWSHDGDWIAFVSWSDFEGGQLYKVASDGSSLTRLSRMSAFYTEPVWVPGDREVLVGRGPWQQRGENMEWVRLPASAGEAVAVAPVSGSRPHFGPSADRFYVYERDNGLVSMRLDGTDRRAHLRVTGMRPPLGPGEAEPAQEVLVSPDGTAALVYADWNVYRVTLPEVEAELSLSVRSDEPPVPVEKLSTLGAEFMNWGAGGTEASWSLGNTLFRYRFTGAVTSEPEQVQVDLQFPRVTGEGTIVLRGGRLLTMDPDAPGDGIVDDGAIVVVDNRIERVGPSADIETPAGAREIDVAGTTILPGFVDLHAHLRPERGMHRNTAWDYLNYLAFGVTTTRNAADPTDNLTYSDLVEMGDFIGPRIFSCGPPILADNDIESLEDARRVVERYRHYYGHNTIKMYLTGDRTVRQWMSLASRELRATPTTEGIDMKTMISQIIDGYSLEHLLPHFPLGEDVVQLVAQSGTFYDPTLVVGTGPRSIYYWWTRTDVHDDPKVRRFTPHDFLDRETRRRPWFHDGEFYFREHAKDLKRIVEAGGKVTVGSHGEMQGISYHWEIWNIQSGGMNELDALRAATLFGAQGIGFEQDLGSLTEGKMADLLVLDEDPLENIRNTTSLRYVMKNGLLYDADTLDALWPVEQKLPTRYWHGKDPESHE